MTTSQRLYQRLLQLDGLSYKAYKDIQGGYQFPDFTLIIDHVQGDPFAAPSRLRVKVPQSKAGFPLGLYHSRSRAIALRDYLNRQFEQVASRLSEKRGSGKSGLIAIAHPGQQVLERSAVWVNDQEVEARFTVGLPARGRTILGRQAAELLCQDLPDIVDAALKYASLNAKAIQHHVEVVEDADWLRSQLPTHNLVSFIPNGAILPRQSGVDDAPLKQGAFPFHSPPSLQVEFDRPNQGKIAGMGIPTGVTLIVGGGYHGKSTLLEAIALGIYNHIPGDGREQLVTDPGAVKIRAEDGRSIAGVDISPFINHLPQGRSTTYFCTENASGSTSQAASIIEALEADATVLLVDEDTSATNFMIRDRRMQALIAKDKEPITPFIDKIRLLYRDYSVSTVLVMGGSGDYFDVADIVIAMTDYEPSDVTAQARAIATQYSTDRVPEGGDDFGDITDRIPLPKRLDSPLEGRQRWGRDRAPRGHWPQDFRSHPYPRTGRSDGGDRWQEEDTSSNAEDIASYRPADRGPKLKVRDVNELVFGTEVIDLAAVEQLVEVGQLQAIGAAIAHLQHHYLDGRRSLSEILDAVIADLEEQGFDGLTPFPQGDLSCFRSLELAAALNRLRSFAVHQLVSGVRKTLN